MISNAALSVMELAASFGVGSVSLLADSIDDLGGRVVLRQAGGELREAPAH